MLKSIALLFCILLQMPVALADTTASQDIYVEQSWAKPVKRAGLAVPVYFQLGNQADEDDRLLSVRVAPDLAARAELRLIEQANGTLKIRRLLDGVPLLAGDDMRFSSGGYHVLLSGTTADLLAEETFPLTFVFEKAGDVTVDIAFKAPEKPPLITRASAQAQ